MINCLKSRMKAGRMIKSRKCTHQKKNAKGKQRDNIERVQWKLKTQDECQKGETYNP